MKKIYVLSSQKQGDMYEDVYPTMNEAVAYGLDHVNSKDGYTNAIVFEVNEEDYERYQEGLMSSQWIGDFATDTVDVMNMTPFKKLLIDKGTTSYKLAKDNDLSQSHLYKLERGDIDITNMAVKTVKPIAKALYMTVDELIEELGG